MTTALTVVPNGYPDELQALSSLLIGIDVDALNGSTGTNRENPAHCQITVANDVEAIYAWLNEYRESPQTWRTYQKEAERLLLWCFIAAKKPLSSLQREDIDAYKAFLLNPQPTDFWCASSGRQIKRGQPGWKPFKGPLSESSLKSALNIINSLFCYLVDAEYLRRNPMKLMRKRVRESETLEVKSLKRQEKILSPRQWQLLLETLQQMPENDYYEKREKYRTQLIIALLYYLGLRVSDLVTAKWSQFKTVHDKWWFEVKGKGGKEALLPVSTKLLDEIKMYREFFRFSRYPKPDEEISVLLSWRSGGGIGARQVNNVLKTLAKNTLERIEPEHDDVEKLTAFSAHKNRHMMGSDLARANLPSHTRRKLMRHSKLETTLEYSHLSESEMHEAINRLSLYNDVSEETLSGTDG